MILRFKKKTGPGIFDADYLNINFDAECFNVGRTNGANYIDVTEDGYKDILCELDFNCFEYHEDFDTGSPNDFHPFLKSDLNSMCLNCKHLYILCDGTKNKVWTGCIWKDADTESLKRYDDYTNGKFFEGGLIK